MGHYRIEIDKTVAVNRDKVFKLFADHKQFGRLLMAPALRIKDSDQADPNGNGSVRLIGVGPVGIREKVTRFEPNEVIEYRLISLTPFRNHRGKIRFSDTSDGGTRIQYTIDYDDILPGTGRLLEFALGTAIKTGINRIPSFA